MCSQGNAALSLVCACRLCPALEALCGRRCLWPLLCLAPSAGATPSSPSPPLRLCSLTLPCWLAGAPACCLHVPARAPTHRPTVHFFCLAGYLASADPSTFSFQQPRPRCRCTPHSALLDQIVILLPPSPPLQPFPSASVPSATTKQPKPFFRLERHCASHLCVTPTQFKV